MLIASARVEALYSLCYTLKFRYKAEDRDFTVMVLEGLLVVGRPDNLRLGWGPA